MTNQLERLEQILGGKIEQKGQRAIPGTISVEGQRVVYFADDGKNPRRQQFQNLIRQVNPPQLKHGGASEGGCTIHVPDGLVFHAMLCHGDIDGWRKQIEQGAQELQLLIAQVDGDKFKVSDGRVIDLADCRIELD